MGLYSLSLSLSSICAPFPFLLLLHWLKTCSFNQYLGESSKCQTRCQALRYNDEYLDDEYTMNSINTVSASGDSQPGGQLYNDLQALDLPAGTL